MYAFGCNWALLDPRSNSRPRFLCCAKPSSSPNPTAGYSISTSSSEKTTDEEIWTGHNKSTSRHEGSNGVQVTARRQRVAKGIYEAAASHVSDASQTHYKGSAMRKLPKVLILHCGGTFGMNVPTSENDCLHAGGPLANLREKFPELAQVSEVTVEPVMNVDSSCIGPAQWVDLAKRLHDARESYDGFVIIHGTDTMAYTGAALSLMLCGFGKAIVLTGAQLPMAMSRSDARQNLIDAVTVATAQRLCEVAICFGGVLYRANCAVKVASSAYRAFNSPNHPPLALMGTTVEWNEDALWKDCDLYMPRFRLNSNVVRISVVPGLDPQVGYGELSKRGVKGIFVEAFGVGNLPDVRGAFWIDWLEKQKKQGVLVYVGSQCVQGPLDMHLYKNGAVALTGGEGSVRRMSAETAMVKMMLCLENPDVNMNTPIAGEL